MSTQTAFRRLAEICIVGTALAMASVIALGLAVYGAAIGHAWGTLGTESTGGLGLPIGAYLLHACLTGKPL